VRINKKLLFWCWGTWSSSRVVEKEIGQKKKKQRVARSPLHGTILEEEKENHTKKKMGERDKKPNVMSGKNCHEGNWDWKKT